MTVVPLHADQLAGSQGFGNTAARYACDSRGFCGGQGHDQLFCEQLRAVVKRYSHPYIEEFSGI
jgi:hypothetical protein